MLVLGGSPVSFNYATFDEVSGLYVAGSIYDISTGSPVFVSKVGMTNQASGIYVGSFTPVAGHFYLVICAVYTDAGFTTPDTTRAPGATNYDAPTTDTSLLNFNYGSFDQNAGLTINVTVYNLTTSTFTTMTMTYVTLGVYFGQYQGSNGFSYLVTQIPTDTSLAPGCNSFQAAVLGGNSTIITNYLNAATLVGQNLAAVLQET